METGCIGVSRRFTDSGGAFSRLKQKRKGHEPGGTGLMDRRCSIQVAAIAKGLGGACRSILVSYRVLSPCAPREKRSFRRAKGDDQIDNACDLVMFRWVP